MLLMLLAHAVFLLHGLVFPLSLSSEMSLNSFGARRYFCLAISNFTNWFILGFDFRVSFANFILCSLGTSNPFVPPDQLVSRTDVCTRTNRKTRLIKIIRRGITIFLRLCNPDISLSLPRFVPVFVWLCVLVLCICKYVLHYWVCTRTHTPTHFAYIHTYIDR